MPRPCSDHVAGYRIFVLAGPEDPDGYVELDVLTKGGVLPRGAAALALPYREDEALGRLAYHAQDRLARHLTGPDGAAPPLPPGAVLLACDDHGVLRVVDRSESVGTPSPGYEPVAPDALLGLLRQRCLTEPQFAALRGGFEAAVADAVAEYRAEFAGLGLRDVRQDRLSHRLQTELLHDRLPAFGAVRIVNAELQELAGRFTEADTRALRPTRSRLAELDAAAWRGWPLEQVEAIVASLETLPLAPLPLDPGPLAARPAATAELTELHLVTMDGEYDYDDQYYSEVLPSYVAFLSRDPATGVRIRESLSLVEGLALAGHELQDRLAASDPNRGPWDRPHRLGSCSRTVVPVVGAGGPTVFEHGCVYVPVTLTGNAWEGDTGFQDLQFLPAHPTAVAAAAAVSAAIAEGGTDQLEALPDLARLDTREELGALVDEHGAPVWQWVDNLPGRVVHRAAAPGEDRWGEPRLGTYVVVAWPLEAIAELAAAHGPAPAS